MLVVTKETFEQEVLKSDKTVLVDFYADWCGPCKMLTPILESLSEEVSDFAKICKINVDDSKEIAQEYGIMSIPTMVIFKEGKEANKVVGIRSKEEIVSMLK